MATIIEAFDAAKAGKAVSHNGHPIIVRHNTLAWEDSVDAVVFVTSNTLNGWTIEEPAPPKPEWVDVPVTWNRMVKGPAGWCEMKDVEDQPGFSGYGFTREDGRKTISNIAFGFSKETSSFIFDTLPEDEVSGIVWCDFVRFDKSKS